MSHNFFLICKKVSNFCWKSMQCMLCRQQKRTSSCRTAGVVNRYVQPYSYTTTHHATPHTRQDNVLFTSHDDCFFVFQFQFKSHHFCCYSHLKYKVGIIMMKPPSFLISISDKLESVFLFSFYNSKVIYNLDKKHLKNL